MTGRKYILTYLDQDEQERVEEVIAYSEAQAFHIAVEFCGRECNIINLECAVNAYYG